MLKLEQFSGKEVVKIFEIHGIVKDFELWFGKEETERCFFS